MFHVADISLSSDTRFVYIDYESQTCEAYNEYAIVCSVA